MSDPASITLSREGLVQRLKNRIDTQLNNRLVDMKEGWDDSISGFNDAWDIVRKVLADEAALAAPARAAPAVPTERVLALATRLRKKSAYFTNRNVVGKMIGEGYNECAAALEALAKEAGNG